MYGLVELEKWREHILVKDGYTAQRPTRPLCKILFELWIECLVKWAHERNMNVGPAIEPFRLMYMTGGGVSKCQNPDSKLPGTLVIYNYSQQNGHEVLPG